MIWVALTTGDTDIDADFIARSLKDFQDLIFKKISKIDGVLSTDLTGQCVSVFVESIVDEVFVEMGLFAPEQLNAASRRYYFRELVNMGVTIDEITERKLG